MLTANMTRTSDSPQILYRSVPKMVSNSNTRGKGHLEISPLQYQRVPIECRMLTLILAILSMLLHKQTYWYGMKSSYLDTDRAAYKSEMLGLCVVRQDEEDLDVD